MQISCDRDRLDRDLIHGFLSTQAYWALGRPREQTERAIDGSLCFGAYADDGAQLAFARVVSDFSVFAYVADVLVVPEARGRGISKAVMRAIIDHPDLRGLRRILLTTADAHGLYAAFGFEPVEPANFLQLLRD